MGLPQGISDFFDGIDTGGFSISPPLTQTASSHAISIKTDRGIKIGRIQSWSVNIARTIDTIFEVSISNQGEPAERVPQVQGTNSIAVERYELFTSHIGEAFGTPVVGDGTDLVNLTLQARPFHVREMWRDPFGDLRAYAYVGCWFSSIGTTIAANDDRIIKARATLEFTRRIKLA